MKVWCFDDVHGWGQSVLMAATKRGHDAIMFDDPNIPDEGVAFVHMHHHPGVRTLHKRMMERLALRGDLLLIPNTRSAALFDDKVEQARHFSRWMPKTHIFQTPYSAREFIERGDCFPFYSKAREGVNGYNVRLIESYGEAKLEAKYAFSDRGIRARYSQKQIGYVLWQEAIEGFDGDLRIMGVGRKRLALRRYADGRTEPMNDMTVQLASALAFAGRFLERENMPWGLVDLVRDRETNRWYMLESSVSWNMESFLGCRIIDSETVTDQTGADIWDAMVVELELGRMGELHSEAA